MEQLSFFGDAGQSKGLPTELLDYHAAIFTAEDSNILLQTFISTIVWEQRYINIYGKRMLTPRLTAWYGDAGKSYAYTGNRFNPFPWTPELLVIKNCIELIAGVTFNSVLLNYYRDGNDSVAWHSDNETELGQYPVIASVSLGQVRTFDIRHKQNHTNKYSIRLESGSLLLMKGNLQQHWEHRIAKSATSMTPRVNLTFRTIT